MTWETEAVPPPSGLKELLGSRSRDAIALEIFSQLDDLKPKHVPPLMAFQDPKALERWQRGAPMDEKLIVPFAAWLKHTKDRSIAIAENERRLRSTTWAQWQLRTERDYWEQFVEFHKQYWGIEDVRADSGEREMQIQDRCRRGAV